MLRPGFGELPDDLQDRDRVLRGGAIAVLRSASAARDRDGQRGRRSRRGQTGRLVRAQDRVGGVDRGSEFESGVHRRAWSGEWCLFRRMRCERHATILTRSEGRLEGYLVALPAVHQGQGRQGGRRRNDSGAGEWARCKTDWLSVM